MSSCKEVFNSGIIVTHQYSNAKIWFISELQGSCLHPFTLCCTIIAKELQLTSTKFIFDRWMTIHVNIIFIRLVANELQTSCIGVVTIDLQYICTELHVFLYVYGAKYNKLQLVQIVQLVQ
jgi:hypothetical protein